MAQQIKRQILRQAVDDNVSAIEGRLPKAAPSSSGGSPGGGRRRALAVVALLAAAITVTALLSSRPGTEPESSVAEVGTIPAEAATSPYDDLTSSLRFPAPRPIDPTVFPLEVRHIVLDPGHGGEDVGTVGGGLSEKDLTLDIALRLRDRLVDNGFEVSMTRDDDTWISLKERADFANQRPADLFVSIHINWLTTRQVRGIETYYLGPTEDPDLIAFARRENQHAGYRLAEMRPILERLYTDIQQRYSHDLASRIQRSLFTSLRRVNPELENRGVKTAPFVVLVSTEMPAILAEVSCLSNSDEVELLSRPLYRDHIADALARGIRGYADDVHQTD